MAPVETPKTRKVPTTWVASNLAQSIILRDLVSHLSKRKTTRKICATWADLNLAQPIIFWDFVRHVSKRTETCKASTRGGYEHRATDHLLDFAGRLLTDNQKLFSFAYRGVFLCRTSEHGDACVSGSRIVAGALGFTEMTLYSRTMRTMYHVVQHCSDIALRVEYMSYTRDTKELSIPF